MSRLISIGCLHCEREARMSTTECVSSWCAAPRLAPTRTPTHGARADPSHMLPRIHARMYLRKHMCGRMKYGSTHLQTQAPTDAHTHGRTHTNTLTRARTHTHTHACTHVLTRTHARTHAHVRTRTH